MSAEKHCRCHHHHPQQHHHHLEVQTASEKWLDQFLLHQCTGGDILAMYNDDDTSVDGDDEDNGNFQ